MNPEPSEPRRGEVWIIDLSPTIGAEIQKKRPVVVVSSDKGPWSNYIFVFLTCA